MIVTEREREREREAETQAEREAGSMHREPDVGFDPGSPGSRPGPKAGAKPLRHPGIPNTWGLNNMPLNNKQIKKLKKKFKEYVERNKNENTMIQDLWDTVKIILREKLIAIQTFLKKQEITQYYTQKSQKKKNKQNLKQAEGMK